MIISLTDEGLKTCVAGLMFIGALIALELLISYYRYKEKQRRSEDEVDRKQLTGYSIPTKKVVTHGTGKEVIVFDEDYYSNG